MPGLGKGCEPRSGVLSAPTCLGCPRSFGSLLTVSPLCKEGEDTAYILVLGEGPGIVLMPWLGTSGIPLGQPWQTS